MILITFLFYKENYTICHRIYFISEDHLLFFLYNKHIMKKKLVCYMF